MKWAVIIKIFFSIRKFVGCPAVKFSRGYELRKEDNLFLIDKKSDLSHYFQDKKWVARLAYLSDIFSYINEFNLKLQCPDTTIFSAWNKIESFKKKLKLWLNVIAEGNNEMFQSYSDYIVEEMISIHRIQFQILLQLT